MCVLIPAMRRPVARAVGPVVALLCGVLPVVPRSAVGVPPDADPARSAGIALDVLLVNDADFPPVDAAQAETILRDARATLADKLGFAEITFNVRGEVRARDFIKRNIALDSTCLEQLKPYRVTPEGRRAQDIPYDVVEKFLKRWQVDALREFFAESQQAGLTGYRAIAARLAAEFDRKIDTIARFKLKDGRSLLAKDKLNQRSYIHWICAARNQNEADLILTNSFILYDLGSEPYPHTVFQKNKVGGASLYSPKRTAIRSRAVVSSTFSMVTDLPFFKEEGIDTLTPAERLLVIGTFIVAHEMGHALFKLPDFYDHPRECLMTTKFETGYVLGYRDLKRYPGECVKCRPYVLAKRHVFAADALKAQGKHKEAIAQLKKAIRATPEHIDGSYLRYVADLSFEIAELHVAAGNAKEAERWIKSILRIVKNHNRALALRDKISGKPSNIPKNKEKSNNTR